jgi:hypothetical protein
VLPSAHTPAAAAAAAAAAASASRLTGKALLRSKLLNDACRCRICAASARLSACCACGGCRLLMGFEGTRTSSSPRPRTLINVVKPINQCQPTLSGVNRGVAVVRAPLTTPPAAAAACDRRVNGSVLCIAGMCLASHRNRLLLLLLLRLLKACCCTLLLLLLPLVDAKASTTSPRKNIDAMIPLQLHSLLLLQWSAEMLGQAMLETRVICSYIYRPTRSSQPHRTTRQRHQETVVSYEANRTEPTQ